MKTKINEKQRIVLEAVRGPVRLRRRNSGRVPKEALAFLRWLDETPGRREQRKKKRGKPMKIESRSEFNPENIIEKDGRWFHDGHDITDLLVWWKCSVCGHDWQATIDERIKGALCPNHLCGGLGCTPDES